MKPDPDSSRQHADDENQSNPDRTTEATRESKAYEGIRQGPTEDALPPGSIEPSYGHPNRPEREKLGGSFKGSGKPTIKRR